MSLKRELFFSNVSAYLMILRWRRPGVVLAQTRRQWPHLWVLQPHPPSHPHLGRSNPSVKTERGLDM